MKKVNTTISMDYDLYGMLKDSGMNISGTINTILKDALVNKDPEAKKYFQAAQNIDKKRKELDKINQELAERMKNFRTEMAKERLEFQKEKESYEELKKGDGW